jgi:hypothetical protein
MKKFFKLSSVAMLALSMAACSSDDAVDNGTIATNGDGYVGIAIQLPNISDGGTRANDDLNNGEEAEFEVKDANLFLFVGDDESTAKYYKMYPLSTDFTNDTDGENEDPDTKVTQTSGVTTAKIENLNLLPSENLYAYVVLNHNKSALSAAPAAGTDFPTFSKMILDAATIGGTLTGEISEDGMLMTNAPISETAGGSQASTGKVFTAVKLDKSQIKKTEEEAKNAPAGCVYVERAAAKVTVSADGATSEVKNGEDPMTFEVLGWQIFNTEPTYYNTRQSGEEAWLGYFNENATNANAKYRFVSKYDFAPTLPGQDHTTGYRTFFGIDPQYDQKATLVNPAAVVDGTWNALTGKAYMTENTFNVENQYWNNTTMACIKVQFNGGESFYSVSNDAKYYAADKINDALAAKAVQMYEVNKWMNDVTAALAKATPGKEYAVAISATVEPSTTAGVKTYTLSYAITEDGAAYTDALPAGMDAAWTTAKTKAESELTVTLYENGVAYYNVRIQHFGEFETPWAAADATQPGETIDQIYGTDVEARNNNFLGRYGIVRNNWYKLTISAIKKLGSAVPETVKDNDTPDDVIEEEQYISVHVHILPWNLRTQDVIL